MLYLAYRTYLQYCGPGLDPDSISAVDPGMQEGNYGPQKLKKNLEISCFASAGCSHFRAEGFSCILDVLYVGLEIKNKKKKKKISSVIFLSVFGHKNPGSESGTGTLVFSENAYRGTYLLT
jgi:hypothetical protein